MQKLVKYLDNKRRYIGFWYCMKFEDEDRAGCIRSPPSVRETDDNIIELVFKVRD